MDGALDRRLTGRFLRDGRSISESYRSRTAALIWGHVPFSVSDEEFEEMKMAIERINGNLDKLDNDSIIRPMYDNRLKGQAWRDNAQLFHNYRFALVLENRKFDGYITEKIFNAFLSGSIPIYYGTEEVFDLFNADAFVYYDPDCPDEALERVKYLEQNQTAYKEVLGQPILAHGDATIKKYFSYTEQFGNGLMKRRIRKMMQFDDSPSVL